MSCRLIRRFLISHYIVFPANCNSFLPFSARRSTAVLLDCAVYFVKKYVKAPRGIGDKHDKRYDNCGDGEYDKHSQKHPNLCQLHQNQCTFHGFKSFRFGYCGQSKAAALSVKTQHRRITISKHSTAPPRHAIMACNRAQSGYNKSCGADLTVCCVEWG